MLRSDSFLKLVVLPQSGGRVPDKFVCSTLRLAREGRMLVVPHIVGKLPVRGKCSRLRIFRDGNAPGFTQVDGKVPVHEHNVEKQLQVPL